MDHGHMDHGGMDNGATCNMNMLFTWDTQNLCIVFSQWRVTGPLSLLLSLVGVALLTAGYELVRSLSKKYEESSQEYANTLPPDQPAHVLSDRGVDDPINNVEQPRSRTWLGRLAGDHLQQSKTIKALFYAAQVFYSFFVMLLFMTYNGYVMLAVTVGAFIGHLAFGGESASKEVSCH